MLFASLGRTTVLCNIEKERAVSSHLQLSRRSGSRGLLFERTSAAATWFDGGGHSEK
jgi:hypothetical protein